LSDITPTIKKFRRKIKMSLFSTLEEVATGAVGTQLIGAAVGKAEELLGFGNKDELSQPVAAEAETEVEQLENSQPTADEITDASVADDQTADAATQTYIVQAGDSLSKISKEFYGKADNYMKIFEANRDILKNPADIEIGQEISIPAV
jgi:nucleoid-associated protein YgaU